MSRTVNGLGELSPSHGQHLTVAGGESSEGVVWVVLEVEVDKPVEAQCRRAMKLGPDELGRSRCNLDSHGHSVRSVRYVGFSSLMYAGT